MPSKLYVSNLSQAATLGSMRELFGACGDVLEVEFAAERGARSYPSAAFITMATSLGAERALSALHGRLHGDRVLVISRVSGEPAALPETVRPARPPANQPRVAITQQYRDRRGLTYELSCSGKLLTLRFIFPLDDAQAWQVEARTLPGPPSAVTASAMTREQALLALIDASVGGPLGAAELDWAEVAAVLRSVRAL
ncbi:MAG TPA: RNA-binding protein [Polyangiaceae bacterium]|nr:RNA-binding protein [Polyangiaceae bacterium]